MANPNVLLYSNLSKYHEICHGGAESSMRVIGEKLAQNGIKTCYFTRGISKFPGIQRKTIDDVDVYFFTPWRWLILKNTFFPKTASWFVRMQRRKVLGNILKKEKIQIVYAYESYPIIFELLIVRKNLGLNFMIVHRIAGLYWAVQIRSGVASASIYEKIFNESDVLNFLSPNSEIMFNKQCQKFGISVNRPRRICCDIGVNFLHFSKRNQLPTNEYFTIICVARFTDYAKRQDLLIEALKMLKVNTVRIWFVGAGKLLDHYKKRASEENLDSWITFHGYVNGKPYSDLLKKADLFALPTDHEGLGKSVLEAMASGVPVLVSDVPPLNTLIAHNQTGFLARNTPESWAETIKYIQQDHDRLIRVAETGHAYARRHFDADQAIHTYMNLFSDICS